MWPQALQMTRDECRGILRRLELESYSQVISVFRAQGGLSDAKAKLLEELRGVFHISNERHRAEARRVANDEQLATIAEAISGPNTWQEWSREGRRPYPMLPRVAPQTALALIANNVAEETAQENAKLPYPAETADVVKEEQQQIENQKSMEAAVERSNYVVTNDPFKMPEIPLNTKKNLKRNINSDHQSNSVGKKRSTGDSFTQQSHAQSGRKNYPHITANSPQTNCAVSSPSISERKQKQTATDIQNNQHLQKQRFFHQQHQINKQKMAKKAAANTSANNATLGSSTTLKRQPTPAKSGRRANQKVHQEQQKQMVIKQLQMDMQHQMQQQQQQHQQIPMQVELSAESATTGIGTPSAPQTILTQQQIDMQFVTYATHHQPPQQIFMEKDIEMAQSPAGTTSAVMPLNSSNQQQPPSLITPSPSPQIAASKRDISKNLNKLQIQQNQQLLSNASNAASPASITPHDSQSSLGNILSTTSVSSPSDKNKLSEKTLISTTPVQKYIVEERQPAAAINLPAGAGGTLVNVQNSHGATSSSTSSTTATHIIQVSNAAQQPQIMSLPQFSAAATKLRAVNTTLIAPGTKIASTATKKIVHNSASSNSTINAGALHELANVASTQSQVLHIVEAGGTNNPTSASHTTPLHTPPAVIQIHNATGSQTATTSSDISPNSTQSKVLTTKILPLVLSGSGNHTNTNSTLINNSTLVVASSPTSSISITTNTTTAGGTTIIKSLPSTMVLKTSTANLTPVTVTSTSNTIISTLGAGATVFRKPPNIIKTSVSSTTPTKSTSPSSAPHIISNVKLTPVSVSASSTGTHLTTSGTFKNTIPSTSGMVRTSVKICQSPNGKVFIQPASLLDGPKMKLNTSSIPHKIISNTSSVNSSVTTGGGQRIAIQKVQIIPAPIGSPAGGNAIQSGSMAGNHLNSKTAKSNMIFMPTAGSNVRPVTLSKMGNSILLKSSANQQMTPTSPTTTIATDNSMAKSNIVVLGPSSTPSIKEQISPKMKLEGNQLINEDTPLDILNMPIVMEPGVGVTSSSSATETVTVLDGNIIDASNISSSSALAAPIILDQSQIHSSKSVVLNVDWEMKLDIEQQNQYNNKNLKQKKALATSSSVQSSSVNQQTSTCDSGQPHSNKPKRLNNDLLALELNSKESNSPFDTSASTTTTSNSVNSMIVLDDSFDDVIVEEHEDDSSSNTSLDKQQQHQHQPQNENDIPKILDMQIYQQHDGHNNRIAQITTTTATNSNITNCNIDSDDNDNDNDNDEKQQSKQFLQSEESTRTDIEQGQSIPDEEQHQQQLQHNECEIDAGFDETIVTEIDENTAIEYIEEDGGSSNVSTTTTNSIPLSNKSDMQQKVSTNTSATIAIATVISNQEDKKSCNSLNNSYNRHLASSMLSEETGTTTSVAVAATSTTSKNEILQTETTANSINATQETTTNNSATQQVEP